MFFYKNSREITITRRAQTASEVPVTLSGTLNQGRLLVEVTFERTASFQNPGQPVMTEAYRAAKAEGREARSSSLPQDPLSRDRRLILLTHENRVELDMVKPLYYIRDPEGNAIGVVVSPEDYEALIMTRTKFIWPKTPGGKPTGSERPVRIEGRSVAKIVIEDRR